MGRGDLGAVLRHQLGAALRDDLGALKPDEAEALDRFEAGLGRPPATFADLLGHPEPGPPLLEAVKRFAKVQRESADAALPAEVATVLYFAALAAALVRHGRRITSMDDAALRQGFGWSSDRPWVDGTSRALFAEAMAVTGGPGRA